MLMEMDKCDLTEILRKIDELLIIFKMLSKDLSAVSNSLKSLLKSKEIEASHSLTELAYEYVYDDEDNSWFTDDQDDDYPDLLPYGYEDILHPEGEGDYDTDSDPY